MCLCAVCSGKSEQISVFGNYISKGVCLFPSAAVTYYHSLDGLKGQKWILSLLWRPEIQKSETKVISRLVPPLALDRVFILCLSPGSGGHGQSLAYRHCQISASVFPSSLPLLWAHLSLDLGWLSGKESARIAGDMGSIPGFGKIPLEKEMATHSSILTWKVPWTEEPGGLHSMGSQRVGRDWTTEHSTTAHITYGKTL